MKIRLSPPTFLRKMFFQIQSKNKILLLYSFPRAAEVNSYKLGALQQQKCIPSQFWRPAQGEHCLERVHPCVSLASGGCLHSLASPSCSCSSLIPAPISRWPSFLCACDSVSKSLSPYKDTNH